MLIRIVLLVLAVIIWLAFYLTGTETHATDGIIFFGLVAAEALVIGLQSRKEQVQVK
jgi:hypothetical protein